MKFSRSFLAFGLCVSLFSLAPKGCADFHNQAAVEEDPSSSDTSNDKEDARILTSEKKEYPKNDDDLVRGLDLPRTLSEEEDQLPKMDLDGPVTLIEKLSEGGALVGGDFQSVRSDVISPKLAKITKDSEFDLEFAKAMASNAPNGVVLAVAEIPDGYLLVGDFTEFSGQQVGRIAIIKKDGQFDEKASSQFGKGFNDRVLQAKVLDDQSFVLGGDFTLYNSESSERVAHLLKDFSLDLNFGKDESQIQTGDTGFDSVSSKITREEALEKMNLINQQILDIKEKQKYIQSLLVKISERTKQLQEPIRNLSSLMKRVNSAVKEVQQSDLEKKEKQSKIADLKQKNADYKEEQKALKSRIKVLKSYKKELSTQKKELAQEIKKAKSAIKKLKKIS